MACGQCMRVSLCYQVVQPRHFSFIKKAHPGNRWFDQSIAPWPTRWAEGGGNESAKDSNGNELCPRSFSVIGLRDTRCEVGRGRASRVSRTSMPMNSTAWCCMPELDARAQSCPSIVRGDKDLRLQGYCHVFGRVIAVRHSSTWQ